MVEVRVSVGVLACQFVQVCARKGTMHLERLESKRGRKLWER